MSFITSRYSPLTCCSDDTAVVRVWTLWRTVRWRWRIDVELIVQHVSTVCHTQRDYYRATRSAQREICPGKLFVRLSVRLSVTRWYSKRLYISSYFCSPSGSPTILVFPYQTRWQYSDGDPLTGASNAWGYEKNHDFRPISRFSGGARGGQPGHVRGVKPCAPAVPRQLNYSDVDHKRISWLRLQQIISKTSTMMLSITLNSFLVSMADIL